MNDDPLSYRIPMSVSDVAQFPGNNFYPRCPRCLLTMEREYQSYCDRCGQALNWKGYAKALHLIILKFK